MEFIHVPDCTECRVGICCQSLKREGDGFDHQSKRFGGACRHLTTCGSCKVHDTLEKVSPDCGAYSCFGAGPFIAKHYNLSIGKRISGKQKLRFALVQYITNSINLCRKILKEEGNEEDTNILHYLSIWEGLLGKINQDMREEDWEEIQMEMEHHKKIFDLALLMVP